MNIMLPGGAIALAAGTMLVVWLRRRSRQG